MAFANDCNIDGEVICATKIDFNGDIKDELTICIKKEGKYKIEFFDIETA